AAYARLRRRELEAAMVAGGVPIDRLHVWEFVDQDAVLHLRELVEAVRTLLAQLRPEAVLTHPYEGGHPDHDAVAFAVHTAAAGLAPVVRPVLLEMPYYHAGPAGEVWGVSRATAGARFISTVARACEKSPWSSAIDRRRGSWRGSRTTSTGCGWRHPTISAPLRLPGTSSTTASVGRCGVARSWPRRRRRRQLTVRPCVDSFSQ